MTLIFFILSGLSLNLLAAPKKVEAAKTIYFKTLKSFDLQKNKSSSEIDALIGKKIRIPGFMVPLEYKSQKVSEFLLVQSVPSCIHVPPPSPNQTILVKMKDKKSVALNMDPIWVIGELKINPQKKYNFGDAVYTILGESSSSVDSKDFSNLGLFMGDQLDMSSFESQVFSESDKKKNKNKNK